jgi:hypothetical protein
MKKLFKLSLLNEQNIKRNLPTWFFALPNFNINQMFLRLDWKERHLIKKKLFVREIIAWNHKWILGNVIKKIGDKNKLSMSLIQLNSKNQL